MKLNADDDSFVTLPCLVLYRPQPTASSTQVALKHSKILTPLPPTHYSGIDRTGMVGIYSRLRKCWHIPGRYESSTLKSRSLAIDIGCSWEHLVGEVGLIVLGDGELSLNFRCQGRRSPFRCGQLQRDGLEVRNGLKFGRRGLRPLGKPGPGKLNELHALLHAKPIIPMVDSLSFTLVYVHGLAST